MKLAELLDCVYSSFLGLPEEVRSSPNSNFWLQSVACKCPCHIANS